MDLRKIAALFLLGYGLSLSQPVRAGITELSEEQLQALGLPSKTEPIFDCRRLLETKSPISPEQLSQMSNTELAILYTKFAMPGYYSRSELTGLPYESSLMFEVSQRIEPVLNEVRRLMKLYGQEDKKTEVVDRLILVTHQTLPHLQTKTARYLRRMENAQVPTLVLLSHAYPVTDRELMQRSSFIRYSAYGELQPDDIVVGREVTLAGGNVSICLAESVEKIVSKAEALGWKEIWLKIEPKLIYDSNGPYTISKLHYKLSVKEDYFFNTIQSTVLKGSVQLSPVKGTFGRSGKWLLGTFKSSNSTIKVHVAFRK